MKKNGRSARAVGLLLTALIAVLSVINAPLIFGASTTNTPSLRPLMIRFRWGKCQ